MRTLLLPRWLRGRAFGARRLITLVVLLLLASPADVAVAGHDFQYASGLGGVGGYFKTSGSDNRDYNRAWHQSGKTWRVFYLDSIGVSCEVTGTLNPTRCEANGSYKQSWCNNIDDNSATQWSCNSTHGLNHRPEELRQTSDTDRGVEQPLMGTAVFGGIAAEAQLDVFQRDRERRDLLPATLPSVFSAVQTDPSKSRAVMEDVGYMAETLYAVPTPAGAVCLALSVRGELGCVDNFSAARPYAWEVRDLDYLGAGEPAFVTGLVAGTIRSVRIRVGGAYVRPAFDNGAFFYELQGPAARPEAIEFRFSEATETVHIPPPPIPPKV